MTIRLTVLCVVVTLFCAACDGKPRPAGGDSAKAVEPGIAPSADGETVPVTGNGVVPAIKREKVALAQMMELRKALELHCLEVGDYPESMQVLARSGDGGTAYIDRIPPDPWGEAYVYRREGKGPVLFSKGPDRKADTEDDIRQE